MSAPMIAARERPILFSGPMVRVLLASKKTQTRRVVKPVRGYEHNNVCRPDMAADPWAVWWHGQSEERVGCLQTCPYGVPGERLWVRETWAAWPLVGAGDLWRVRYQADGTHRDFTPPEDWRPPRCLSRDDTANAPSIFLPRWASRLTLDITDVRVERVQAISEADAEAEGVAPDESGLRRWGPYKSAFAFLWQTLNGKRGYGWDVNPWVWVIAFRRVDG